MAFDTSLAFDAALAAAGLHDLDPRDLAFLRQAYDRLREPLPVPTGFRTTTEPACLMDIFTEKR
jgi:hypothetical protein